MDLDMFWTDCTFSYVFAWFNIDMYKVLWSWAICVIVTEMFRYLMYHKVGSIIPLVLKPEMLLTNIASISNECRMKKYKP